MINDIQYQWENMKQRGVQVPRIRSNSAAFFFKNDIWFIGGKGVGLLNDVWKYSVASTTWENILYSGTPPR